LGVLKILIKRLPEGSSLCEELDEEEQFVEHGLCQQCSECKFYGLP